MSASPSGPRIGANRHGPGTGIDEGWLREGGHRMLVFIVLSLLLHACLLGIRFGQLRFTTPASAVRESRLDLRFRPQGPALSPAAPRMTETIQPKPMLQSAQPRQRALQATRATSVTSGATRSEAPTGDEAAPAPSSIDYAAARETARQTARSPQRTKPTFEVPVTPVAEPETALGHSIQRAVHPDCRSRYAGAGLLAIPLLLNDAVRDGGCRW